MSECRPSMVPSRGRLGSHSYKCLLSTWWGGIVSVLKAGIYLSLVPQNSPYCRASHLSTRATFLGSLCPSSS